MAERITTSDVKRINKNRIFRLIHSMDRISRQEIAMNLGLSLPTVNQNLRILMDEGLIKYVGSFESTGGRKAQVIAVNETARSAVNIVIKSDYIKAAAVNLNGVIIGEKRVDAVFSESDEYSRIIADLVEVIIQDNNLSQNSILGVGINVPGIFNKTGDIIIAAPTIHISNYPIEKLKKYIKFPCKVMNDAKSGAYAEGWESSHNESDESVYLLIDDGVGGSINGGNGYNVYNGMNNRAGEFGHMTVVPDGRICECGRKGCFEAYISTARISTDLGISLEEFFQGTAEGYAKYERKFNEYLDYLTIGINSIYSIFDSKVIIGGPLVEYLEPYVDIIRASLKNRSSFVTDGTYFELSKLGREQASIGAALSFLGDYIEQV